MADTRGIMPSPTVSEEIVFYRIKYKDRLSVHPKPLPKQILANYTLNKLKREDACLSIV